MWNIWNIPTARSRGISVDSSFMTIDLSSGNATPQSTISSLTKVSGILTIATNRIRVTAPFTDDDERQSSVAVIKGYFAELHQNSVLTEISNHQRLLEDHLVKLFAFNSAANATEDLEAIKKAVRHPPKSKEYLKGFTTLIGNAKKRIEELDTASHTFYNSPLPSYFPQRPAFVKRLGIYKTVAARRRARKKRQDAILKRRKEKDQTEATNVLPLIGSISGFMASYETSQF
jgi:hypothetical protein